MKRYVNAAKNTEPINWPEGSEEYEYINTLRSVFKAKSKQQRNDLMDQVDYLFRGITNNQPALRRLTRNGLYYYLVNNEMPPTEEPGNYGSRDWRYPED